MLFKTAASGSDHEAPRAAVNGCRARVEGDMPKPSVLLVAGPSGAGKSTFIDLLRRGQLSPEIWAELPFGADSWPHLEANDLLKRGVGSASTLIDKLNGGGGVVLHYDIAFIYRYGLQAYEKDPAAALFAVDECTIVCLKPARERLMTQYASRREQQLRNKGRLRGPWARQVRFPVKRAIARLRGRVVPEAIALYKEHDWLGQCYGRWEAFVRAIVRDRPGTKVLYVEPCGDQAGDPIFRLI
jgi:hypothetical protein